MRKSDLKDTEQENVRAALRFLRTRLDGWESLAKALGISAVTLRQAVSARRPASASLAYRVARLAGVGVDEVLTGRFPAPGVCPYCGHASEHPVTAGFSDGATSVELS